MYLDFLVEIPDVKGKITRRKKGGTTYINFEFGRLYDPGKQYNTPLRSTIGKQSEADDTKMWPNQNFLQYFPDVALPSEKGQAPRSSCLKVGSFLIIKKIMADYCLDSMIERIIGKDSGLFLDLAAYTIICENNAGQYYPDYAYNHPLFTSAMKMYSDSKVSDFLHSVTDGQSVAFLNEWNGKRNHREKIYISYDSTNKNCQAGDIEMLEFGKPKDDKGVRIFNYAIAYDADNREPLLYEEYPGSIVDVSQLQYMLEKVKAYGYKKVGFILDRGYFSRGNIQYMDCCGYDFVIMVKGMGNLVSALITGRQGTFEKTRSCSIGEYHVYGTTVMHKLYEGDTRERYFHLFHSISKEHAEREALEQRIEHMSSMLKKNEGKEVGFGAAYTEYFDLYYNEGGRKFLFAKEKTDVVEREIGLCGYFSIVTSTKMTAREAIGLYKSRDASEKLFRGDKSYLGNKSLRVHSDESASAKIFIEFVALIIRSKIYTSLKDEVLRNDKRANFMTAPAALKELDKIEMGKQFDGVYRLNHAVTATQKAILKAFDVDEAYIKSKAKALGEEMANNKKTKAE
ncbi:MAG: transposase [Spirochaetia bacterium]|nr:transposase [Spirochaetia bacterium]